MTDKTQATAHAEITAPISADLRRIDGAGAKSAPITLMTEDRACTWAWDQVREEVGTEGWTAGDSCTFYGFFLWGWNYRGQYEAQRPAAPPSPAAVDGRTPPDMLVNGGALKLALNVLRRAGKNEVADELEKTAAPAQEHATQLAGQRPRTPGSFVNAAGIHASDKPATVVRKLDAAFHDAVTFADTPAQTQGCTRSHPHEEMTPMCVLRTEIARLHHAAANAQAQEVARDHTAVLCDLLNRRPAMNAGLDAEYAAWSDECYRVMDALSQAAANDDGSQEDAPDAVRALIATHAEMLEDNSYAYFELAYTRQTGWMAWITDKPLYGAPVVNPDRKVLAQGQGDTPDEACADAARAAQGGDKP